MGRAKAPLMLAVAAMVLAGCTASTPPPPPEQPVEPTLALPAPPTNATVAANASALPHYAASRFNGHLTLAAGSNQAGYVNPTGNTDAHLFKFKVNASATALWLEVAWADSLADLDLVLHSPSCDPLAAKGVCLQADGGSPGQGDSPVQYLYANPAGLNETGEWELGIWAKDAVNVDFVAAATVFYGMAPPTGYTALNVTA